MPIFTKPEIRDLEFAYEHASFGYSVVLKSVLDGKPINPDFSDWEEWNPRTGPDYAAQAAAKFAKTGNDAYRKEMRHFLSSMDYSNPGMPMRPWIGEPA